MHIVKSLDKEASLNIRDNMPIRRFIFPRNGIYMYSRCVIDQNRGGAEIHNPRRQEMAQ